MWCRYLFSKERSGKKGQVYGSLLEALKKSKQPLLTEKLQFSNISKKYLVIEPTLIHQFFAIFAKANCSLFENFQKPEINMVSKNITNG
jgi:hypothetical protein